MHYVAKNKHDVTDSNEQGKVILNPLTSLTTELVLCSFKMRSSNSSKTVLSH